MTIGKTIALTIWTFVGKEFVLLFNTLSRFVIAFLPRSKCLLISWLQSPSAVASVVSYSVQPHRWQPTRLPHPWDSPGKNTGVACHLLPQCMKVKSESEVAQSCPTLSNPMDCSSPGSSVHGIFQARVLEWGAVAFSTFITICKIR